MGKEKFSDKTGAKIIMSRKKNQLSSAHPKPYSVINWNVSPFQMIFYCYSYNEITFLELFQNSGLLNNDYTFCLLPV